MVAALGHMLAINLSGFELFIICLLLVPFLFVVVLMRSAQRRSAAGVTTTPPTPSTPPPTAPPTAPGAADGSPGQWGPDPLGRHQFRYHDGTSWTEHVMDGTRPSVDPPQPS